MNTPADYIDVASLERELTALWRELGEGEGVIRSSVLNLIVCVRAGTPLAALDELIAELTAAHPSRVILLASDRAATTSSVNAFVTSRCSLPTSYSRQVCCEQITIEARGASALETPSAIAPLLVADLPVFLWWNREPELSDPLLRRLIKLSDRLIVDSDLAMDPVAALLDLARLVRGEGRYHHLTDLCWARLNLWRSIIAGFYDVAAYRPALDRLRRVRIACAPTSPRAVCPAALLLAGWLGSRLGWQRRDSELFPGGFAFDFERGGRMIRLEIVAAEGSRSAIEEVILEASPLDDSTDPDGQDQSEPPPSFRVGLDGRGARLAATVELPSACHFERVISSDQGATVDLLRRELDLSGRDRVFEEALLFAAELVAGSAVSSLRG
jgi:glucose-6-phosphate dehydrogenase assembly protein OpcA